MNVQLGVLRFIYCSAVQWVNDAFCVSESHSHPGIVGCGVGILYTGPPASRVPLCARVAMCREFTSSESRLYVISARDPACLKSLAMDRVSAAIAERLARSRGGDEDTVTEEDAQISISRTHVHSHLFGAVPSQQQNRIDAAVSCVLLLLSPVTQLW